MLSCIACVSPSTPPTKDELHTTLSVLRERYPSIRFLNYASSARLTEEERFELLWAAMTHPEVEMIWSVRGGEGCADLIPFLDRKKQALQQVRSKILLGFSDTTALLFYWFQSLRWPALHGPSAHQMASGRLEHYTSKIIDELIREKRPSVTFACKPLNDAARVEECRGPIFAANLTLLALAQKELWEPHCFKNAIVLIEDVGEATYRVRRACHYLKRLGYWDHLRALVIGDFFEKPISLDPERDRNERLWLQDFFESFATGLKIPVYQTKEVGHGRHNVMISYGAPALIAQDIFLVTSE